MPDQGRKRKGGARTSGHQSRLSTRPSAYDISVVGTRHPIWSCMVTYRHIWSRSRWGGVWSHQLTGRRVGSMLGAVMVPMNTDPTQQTERQWNDWGDLRVRIEPMQATGTSAAHPCRRRVGGLRSALEPMAGCGPARVPVRDLPQVVRGCAGTAHSQAGRALGADADRRQLAVVCEPGGGDQAGGHHATCQTRAGSKRTSSQAATEGGPCARGVDGQPGSRGR